MKTVSRHGHEVDELIDLQHGAWRRLGSAIWDLRQHAERISQDNGKEADGQLKAAKRDLVEVERCLLAYRDYSSQLEKLVG